MKNSNNFDNFNYFKTIEDKYKSKISVNKPVVIRLDGRHICSNKSINLLDETNGSFSDVLKKTCEYLSNRFSCIAYFATDEINLIFQKPKFLQMMYESIDTQRIASLISQEVFNYFNKNYEKNVYDKTIYFDARCFNIPEWKVASYIRYRRQCSKNVLTTYYAKQKLPYLNRRGLSLKKLEDVLMNKFMDFNTRTSFQIEGGIYSCGADLSIDELLESLEKETGKKITSANDDLFS